jgi:hypothetical protein
MAGIFTLLALLTVPSGAQATSLADLTIDQMTDASTYIVQGSIDRVWTEIDDNNHVWTRAHMTVDATLKGPNTPSELIIDSFGGIHTDGTVTKMIAAARFSNSEEVFLFLDVVDHGKRLVPVAKFLGKYSVRRAPRDTEKLVQRWHTSTMTHFDARFLPFPEAETRVYLTDLIDTVNNRLDVGWNGDSIPGISNSELHEINTPERRMR